MAVSLAVVGYNEQAATPQLAQDGAVNISMIDQAGGNMEGKESRFGITTILYLGSLHHICIQWICQFHARQLHADRRHDTDAADDAGRSRVWRYGLRTIRYAGFCYSDGLHSGFDGGADSGIPWQED